MGERQKEGIVIIQKNMSAIEMRGAQEITAETERKVEVKKVIEKARTRGWNKKIKGDQRKKETLLGLLWEVEDDGEAAGVGKT